MGDQEAKIPNRQEGSLDVKFIVLIFALSIVYYFTNSPDLDVSGLDAFDIVDPLIWGISSVVAFIVGIRYRGSQVLGKAYFSLGIGLGMMTIGQITWIYYENIGYDPYPSLADIGFAGYYVFGAIHLIYNITIFKKKLESVQKLWLIAVPAIIVVTFTYLAITEWGVYDELYFDLFYALIFIGGAAVLLSWSVVGTATFRHSILGKAWLVLTVGIVIVSVADVWYYYIEIFEGWYTGHITSTMWAFGYMLMTYALYKHRKVL